MSASFEIHELNPVLGHLEGFGWHHSAWDEIEALQVAENGVNVALTFSRYNAEDEVISRFKTLYLVTHQNGRWGIRARSSFAP